MEKCNCDIVQELYDKTFLYDALDFLKENPTKNLPQGYKKTIVDNYSTLLENGKPADGIYNLGDERFIYEVKIFDNFGDIYITPIQYMNLV